MEANTGTEIERKVMVAIDESEDSYHTLVWVLDNLKESLSEAPLVIFKAQPAAYNMPIAPGLASARMFWSMTTSPEFINSFQENHRKLTSAFLEKAKEICASRGVNAEIITEVGDPKTTICDLVQKLNISMLVLGDREPGKIKRAILGSVSSYCCRYAKCPVLLVKKP